MWDNCNGNCKTQGKLKVKCPHVSESEDESYIKDNEEVILTVSRHPRQDPLVA